MVNEPVHLIEGIATAQISLFGMLIDHLDRQGEMDKAKFRDEMAAVLRISEARSQVLQPHHHMIFKGVISWLSAQPQTWTPVVVGGFEHLEQTATAPDATCGLATSCPHKRA
ncbi:MAG: hypothetical protein SFV19_09365 [Rhodospirillaceae bacterium]|nr:hypothetical protein [Rhodospirillaceae bacterium]